MRSTLYGAKRQSPAEWRSGREAHTEDEMLRENETLLDALAATAVRMKTSAGTLSDETAEHNRLLQTVSGAFDRARGGVDRSVQRIEGVMARYGCRHALLFGVLLFCTVCFLYYVLR